MCTSKRKRSKRPKVSKPNVYCSHLWAAALEYAGCGGKRASERIWRERTHKQTNVITAAQAKLELQAKRNEKNKRNWRERTHKQTNVLDRSKQRAKLGERTPKRTDVDAQNCKYMSVCIYIYLYVAFKQRETATLCICTNNQICNR